MWDSAKQCRVGLFQDSNFAGDLEDSKSTSGGTLCVLGRWNHFSWCRFTHGWNSSSWSLGFGLKKCSILHQTNSTTPKIKYRETCRVIPHQTSTPKTKPRFHPSTTILIWTMLTMPSNARFSRFGVILYIFEDNEAVIKMIIKGRSPTMRHGSRTHSFALEWLFDRINLDPKNKIKYIDTKNQLAEIFTKVNFRRDEWNHLFCACSISAISALSAALRISAWPAAPEPWQKGCKNREETTRSWWSQRRRWTWSHLSWQVLRLCSFRLRRKALGYSKHPVEQSGQVQGNLTQEIAITTQRRVLKKGKKESTRRLFATEEDQGHRNFPKDSKSMRRLVASGNSDTESKDKLWAHNSHTSTDCVRQMEKVFSIVTKRHGLSPRNKMERPRCERSHMVYIQVRYSSSCSTSFDRLHGNFAFYQESDQEIIETFVSSDSDADHWPDWNYWYHYDWLAAAHVERDDFADWQSCSICNCHNLRLFRLSAVWEVAVTNQWKSGKAWLNGFWRRAISTIWIESTGNRWSSCGKFSQDSLHWEFSTKFKRWWRN